MRKYYSAVFAAALLVCSTPIASRADCVEDQRKVSLDGKNQALLKRYTCGIGAGDHQAIHIEFHRLAPNVAGLLLANGSTPMLRRSLGSPKIIENDVWRAYGELNAKFGEVERVPEKGSEQGPALSIAAPRAQNGAALLPSQSAAADDVISLKEFRHTESSPDYRDYPATAEITALLRKNVPGNLNYGFSTVDCEIKGDVFCIKFRNTGMDINFWRPLRAEDFEKYGDNVQEYNSNLMKIRKNAKFAKEDSISIEAPATLRLLAHVAGGEWPEDFAIMTGQYTRQLRAICGQDNTVVTDLMGLNGWSFSYTGRALFLDVAVIENGSSQPVVVDSLIGRRAATTKLRPMDEHATSGAAASLDALSETLAPHARLLIPTRIVLPAARADDTDADKFVGDEESELRKALAAHLAAKGFKLEADNFKRMPPAKDYVYGPELIVSGATVNSTPLTIAARYAANEIDLSVTAEVGSCPYLLSWDATAHDWTKEGKVLHFAPNASRAYAETRRFEGLKTRFRIEEREPEVAHLERLRLKLELDDGGTMELAPIRAPEQSLELSWGDGVTFDFALAEGVDPWRVTASALTVEGYYRRYEVLDHAALRRNRLNAENVIDSKSLERDWCEKPVSTFSHRALAEDEAAPVDALGASDAVCVATSKAGGRASLIAR